MSQRIFKSYQTFRRYIEEFRQKGYQVYEVDYESYKQLYKGAKEGLYTGGKPVKQNIARFLARNFGLRTSFAEANRIIEQIVLDFGEEVIKLGLYKPKDIMAFSGRQLWTFLQGLGYTDAQAGYIYDGEAVVKGLRYMSNEEVNALRRKKK